MFMFFEYSIVPFFLPKNAPRAHHTIGGRMAGEGGALSGDSGMYPTIERYGGLPDSGNRI